MMLAHRLAGSGNPTLVFVHGFTCDRSDWDAQFTALASRWRCLAVDLPGHGATARPAAPASIEACARAVNVTLTVLGLDDVVLIGHSMGCRVACEASRQAPGRVRGIVCIDGSRVVGAGVLERLRSQVAPPGGMEQFLAGFYRDFSVAATPAWVRELFEARRAGIDIDHARELLLAFVRWDEEGASSALAAVRAPLLVLQTTALDASMRRVPIPAGATTPWLDLVRAQVPAAEFATLPGVGHFPMLEAPAATTALIERFVAALPERPGRH